MTGDAQTGLKPLLGTDEVAEILGCSKEYAQEHATELGGVLIARKWKWTEEALAGALRRMVSATAVPAEPVTVRPGVTVTAPRLGGRGRWAKR